MVTLKASEIRPEELIGLPALQDRERVTRFYPLHHLYRLTERYVEERRKEDPAFPEPGPIWLFLDEFSNTPPEMAASYQYLVLNRVLGGLDGDRLRDNVRIVAAGNRESDGCYAFAHLSMAMKSRFAHLEIEPDREEWLRWARGHRVWPTIRAFLGHQDGREHFYRLDPTSSEHTFASPRTWVMLSDLYHAMAQRGVTDASVRRRAALATLGVSSGRVYWHFEQVVANAPSADQIADDPDGISDFAHDPGTALVVVELTLSAVRQDPARFWKPMSRYIRRMHREYRVLFAQELLNLHGNVSERVLSEILASEEFLALQEDLRFVGDLCAQAA